MHITAIYKTVTRGIMMSSSTTLEQLVGYPTWHTKSHWSGAKGALGIGPKIWFTHCKYRFDLVTDSLCYNHKRQELLQLVACTFLLNNIHIHY